MSMRYARNVNSAPHGPLLWAVAAIGLWVKGFPYLLENGSNSWFEFFILSISLCLGWSKSTFILDRVARRIIRNATTHTSFKPSMNGVLRVIFMIVLMSGLGWGIRELPYNPTVKRWIVSLLYPGIGFAL